jgi:hypothetical protein
MGRIVKQVSDNTSRYYWYPGEKAEWLRAVVAVGAGALALAAVAVITGNTLGAVVTGSSITAAIAGCNFGRRDARALAALPEASDKAARRAAIAHTGPAAWRGVVEGVGAAGAAVLIVNLPASGIAANWLLPGVPAAVGALSHQAGMLYERLGRASAPVAKSSASARQPQVAGQLQVAGHMQVAEGG